MTWMPPVSAYMALAEALHAEDETCMANYAVPFEECATREWDIAQAVKVLVAAHKAGWVLVPDSAGSLELWVNP